MISVILVDIDENMLCPHVHWHRHFCRSMSEATRLRRYADTERCPLAERIRSRSTTKRWLGSMTAMCFFKSVQFFIHSDVIQKFKCIPICAAHDHPTINSYPWSSYVPQWFDLIHGSVTSITKACSFKVSLLRRQTVDFLSSFKYHPERYIFPLERTVRGVNSSTERF